MTDNSKILIRSRSRSKFHLTEIVEAKFYTRKDANHNLFLLYELGAEL